MLVSGDVAGHGVTGRSASKQTAGWCWRARAVRPGDCCSSCAARDTRWGALAGGCGAAAVRPRRRPAPLRASRRSLSAATRAGSSTSPPRAVLTSTAVGRIRPSAAGIDQLAVLRAQVGMQGHEIAPRSAARPATRSRRPVRRRRRRPARTSHASMRMPNAAARRATARADVAEADDARACTRAARPAAAVSSARRACRPPCGSSRRANSSRYASTESATGSLKASGVLQTTMPLRARAASRSIESMPVPHFAMTRSRGAASRHRLGDPIVAADDGVDVADQGQELVPRRGARYRRMHEAGGSLLVPAPRGTARWPGRRAAR